MGPIIFQIRKYKWSNFRIEKEYKRENVMKIVARPLNFMCLVNECVVLNITGRLRIQNLSKIRTS